MAAVGGITLGSVLLMMVVLLAAYIITEVVIFALKIVVGNIPVIKRYLNNIESWVRTKVNTAKTWLWKSAALPLIHFIRHPADLTNQIGASISNFMYKVTVWTQSAGHIIGNRLGLFDLINNVAALKQKVEALAHAAGVVASTGLITDAHIAKVAFSVLERDFPAINNRIAQAEHTAKVYTDMSVNVLMNDIAKANAQIGYLWNDYANLKSRVDVFAEQIGAELKTWVMQNINTMEQNLSNTLDKAFNEAQTNIGVNTATLTSTILTLTFALEATATFLEECAAPMCEQIHPQLGSMQGIGALLAEGELLALITEILQDPQGAVEVVQELFNPVIQEAETMINALRKGGS
jgi:hypothetical protein